jgi:hypothetical protein
MHSAFLSACEGGGLALAAGCLVGAAARPRLLIVIAAALGALVFALALDAGDHTVLPGIVGGVLLGALAFAVTSAIAAGAAGRAGEGAAATVSALLVVAALVLAGLSLLVPPVAIAALAVIVFLAVARRRRAARKYAGLRILR